MNCSVEPTWTLGKPCQTCPCWILLFSKWSDVQINIKCTCTSSKTCGGNERYNSFSMEQPWILLQPIYYQHHLGCICSFSSPWSVLTVLLWFSSSGYVAKNHNNHTKNTFAGVLKKSCIPNEHQIILSWEWWSTSEIVFVWLGLIILHWLKQRVPLNFQVPPFF